MKKLKIKSKRISIIELSISSFLKYNNWNVSFIYGGIIYGKQTNNR